MRRPLTCIIRANGRDSLHSRDLIAKFETMGFLTFCEGCTEHNRYTYAVFHADGDAAICKICLMPFDPIEFQPDDPDDDPIAQADPDVCLLCQTAGATSSTPEVHHDAAPCHDASG